ncbi:MAG: hypothetical protein J7M40_06060 [Planctomycetes bacterium]|nr:hypothetical protein [Planctomycetota bacterium]
MLDQLGDHLILPGQLLIELLDLVLKVVLAAGLFRGKRRSAVFEERLLPLVKLGRGDSDPWTDLLYLGNIEIKPDQKRYEVNIPESTDWKKLRKPHGH